MNTQFSPFYDPSGTDGSLSLSSKAAISFVAGMLYVGAQYSVMPSKNDFFDQYCWVLGALISTSLMCLYLASHVFRNNLEKINSLQGDRKVSNEIVQRWLNNRRHLISGVFWGSTNMAVAHLLGIPGEFHSTFTSLAMMYFGYFASGFAAGMGVLAIVGVILLYLRLAPSLHHSLNPNDPDGNGGIKELGDSLWFFALLISAVGLLIAIYMFNVDWVLMHQPYAKWLFVFWIAQPFLVAISIVLIPGLALRRQIQYYKQYRLEQLRKEKAALYASYKTFEDSDDEAIVRQKKEISGRLTAIQNQIQNLKKMRSSHIDGLEIS